MTALDLTLIYLLAAVLGVVLCRSLHLPPMLGYLAVGVLIGPNALALAQNSEGMRHLAEFGVVFLMFVIGLEFNLPKLRAMRGHVFALGGLQVLLTLAAVTLGSAILAWALPQFWPMPWQTALALAGALAMSSTAIVVKLMAERAELESEHGKRVMGVLLFQDLAVVPLLILIPALGTQTESIAQEMGLALLKGALLIGVLLVGGQWVMQRWLTLVARRKSEELFVLNVLLTTLGLAWLTDLAGLSLELGAFIAGMLISETPYKQQVEGDIRAFHDVLLGLFFISIGMMLDWRLVLQNWALVLVLLVTPLLFKAALVTLIARVLGASTGVAMRTGLYLAQAGEFGFVLLALAQKSHLTSPELINPILASMVLSMMATPFIIAHANTVVMKLVASEWLLQSLQMTKIARQSINTREHVIICGFGRCGQNLARMLEGEKIPYIALDLDPDRVAQAAAAGNAVVFGDASRPQALMAAGLARASAVVLTYLDSPGALKVLAAIREHAPNIPVIVRTQDDHDLDKLQRAGATEVVPEAIEGSLMLASHALALVGVPMRRVIRLVQQQRDARYQLLRGYFHGADDSPVEEGDEEHLRSVTLAQDLSDPLALWATRLLPARLVQVRRAQGEVLAPEMSLMLQRGDTLVLSGSRDALALAEEQLLR